MDQFVENLLNPEVYDHPVQPFQVLETHISWVILTGDFAYKIKKPVDFAFLNYSTLEKRKFYCEEEIRLNQFLAPELYVGVVPITGENNSLRMNGKGQAIEYAVKMRQFSQDLIFSQLLARNGLTPLLIEQLAQFIADFHQRTPVADKSSVLGTPEHVHAPVVQNFEQILPLLTEEEDKTQMAFLQQWSEEQFKQHEKLFAQRKKQGFIRDCHGDLHLGNIILYQGKPILFDRIEFNEDFRWTDVIADIAFIAMDLAAHQQPEMAKHLLNSYFSFTGDYAGLAILPYYQAQRAIVRAKVNLFGLFQPQLSAEKKQEILQRYRKFMQLAQQYTQQKNPVLFITSGFTGSGKSTLAQKLVEKIAAYQLRSDVERKRLFGFNRTETTHSEVNKGIYEKEATQKTYDHLAEQAKIILQAGYSVIVDASFLKKAQREKFQHLAKELKVPFFILNCQVSRAQIETWIKERQTEMRDPSEGRMEVLTMQEETAEPLTSDEQKVALKIDTATMDIAKILISIHAVIPVME